MANFEIDEDQAALIRELRKLETSDPVHANVYNALFEKLINNDAFLERLANKMIEKSMLCHVLDSVNTQQVLAADVGPKITKITDGLQKSISGLNTDLINPLLIKTFTYSQSITLAPNGGQEIRIPITVPDGYMFLCVTNVKSNGNVAYACYIASSSNILTCFVGNDRNEQKIIPQGISADALFMKKWW